jgi:HK97 family phage portal protein
MQHLDLVGEAWWLIARSKFGNAGPPLELWPVRPDKMAPVPDPENFISGYVYKNGQEAAPLNLQDVILLKQPNPLDLYRGAGPVQSVLMELDSDRFSAQWNRNFFLNDATPGGIVELNSTLSDAEFEEFNLRWREQHQGIANSHRVALLEKGATWKERQFSQKDMQFNALRDLSRDRIMEAFGFPKPILGIVTDVNRANAEAAEVVLARWLIKPRLERIKQTLNEKFLPLYGTSGQGVFFDYDDPTPDDRAQDTLDLTAKCNAAKTLVEAGFDPAEVCAYLGLPDLTAAEIVAKAGI